MKSFLQILDKLISFKSITPKSNGAIEYIAEFLSNIGFVCDIQVFGDLESEKTTNLYARYGNDGLNICFAGHVDVVPPMNEDAWRYDPFKMAIDGERVYGRGVVDMKGSIACALSAAKDYLKNNKTHAGSISFLLTSDEEGVAKYGTAKMLQYLENKGEKIDFAILGEPTTKYKLGDLIKIGRRGSVNFDLTINGQQGHVAYPERASNPISIMIKIASDLIAIDFDKDKNILLPLSSKTNLEITSIDVGNNVCNIIPSSISMKFNVRFNQTHSAKSILAVVTEIIAKYETNFDLQYYSSSEPFEQKYSSKMQKFTSIVNQECSLQPFIDNSGGTSDARFIHKYCEVVEFGLASDQAHKIDEHTKISDLQNLYNVYYSALINFLEND